uniref:BAR domain-containing protein n=1 Tax=Amphimedon queenslandica TaxID=400682 RepID=A0A1X7TWV4_AMPQE
MSSSMSSQSSPRGDSGSPSPFPLPQDQSQFQWELIDLQDCLHDSPQFRRLLQAKEKEMNDLEMKLRKVVQCCSKMVETGQIYMSNLRLFGMSLKELSCHFTDQQPVVSDALVKFCDIMNEVQTFYSVRELHV